MSLESSLRALVLADIALTVALITVGVVGEPLLPAALQAYLDTQSSIPWNTGDWILATVDLSLFGLTVIAWIGLLRGRWWSRRLYTWLRAFSLPLLLFAGPYVDSALGQFLVTLVNLVGGIILGILYFSELRHRYTRGLPPLVSTQ